MKHCPNCGVRITPTPKEMRVWRKAAHLTQGEMGQRLKISAACVAYLESGKRSPSATVIARFWKLIEMNTRHAAAPSHFMTVAEVAEYLRINPSTIYRLLRKRQLPLPVFTVGSDYRFDKEAIDKWMTDEQVKC